MDTTKEIATAVKKYLGGQCMTLKDAGDILGLGRSAVSNQLQGERPFGKATARRWAAAFGFDPHYLITGEGTLFPDGQPAEPEPKRAAETAPGDVVIPAAVADMYRNMSATILSQQETIQLLVRSSLPSTSAALQQKKAGDPLDQGVRR
jgi:transcriptional regulator with XRE-family HTH domain